MQSLLMNCCCRVCLRRTAVSRHVCDRTAAATGFVRRAAAIVDAVDGGESVNEVEAAGNTPLHHAAYEGWLQGAELLLSLGAHINASNNAGDRPWHWARNMGHTDLIEMLEQVWYTP